VEIELDIDIWNGLDPLDLLLLGDHRFSLLLFWCFGIAF